MTQAQLAESLGVSTNAVSLFETGTNGCSLKNLLLISDLLEVSMDYLTKGKQSVDIEDPMFIRFANLTDKEKEQLIKFVDIYHPPAA